MTTSLSPLHVLKAQAIVIARKMKQAEAGTLVDPTGKVAIARATQPNFKTGIVQDDKIITIDLTWGAIRDTAEDALVEMILKQMRGATDAS